MKTRLSVLLPLFTLICLFSLTSRTLAGEEIKPFFFDGCSSVAEGTKDNPNLWCDCCLEHDMKYWKGGTWTDRRNADLEFKECVSDLSGNPSLGLLFYLGVRVGGSPYYNTSYRWGFGWDYGRDYKTLTDAEESDAMAKAQSWFEENPDMCSDFN
ncbi:MAG: FAD-binding oxidoreductase [Proteobacteria bacterium]|nr:FAD-binding oxidoreductase [Pseudomonadota bacterium]